MNTAGLLLLCLSAACSAPMYFERFQGSGNRRRYAVTAVALALLGAAALLGANAPADAAGLGPGAYAFGVAAAAVGGGPVTVSVLKLSFHASHPESRPESGTEAGAEMPRASPDTGGTSEGAAGAGADGNGIPAAAASEHPPVLRGGAWIGVLERTAIASTLLADWPEGLAVVLAVKGLGRYSELGQSGAAERFIMGTFTSVLYAAAVTGIIRLIS
jgi:hypothetical protein